MIKNVVFDFGDVIAKFCPERIAGAFVGEEDRKLVTDVVFREEWRELDEGTKDYGEYIAETKEMLPERLGETLDRLFRDWYRELPYVDGVWEMVQSLKKKGYRLYILSNASAYFAQKSSYFEITREFDGIVFSGVVKMAKPGDGIYSYLFETFGLKPEECLFIDDREDNIEAGKRNGMNGVVFQGDWGAVWDVLGEKGKTLDRKKPSLL